MIFVAGATGYIGQRLLAAAARRGPAAGISSSDPGMLRLDLARPELFDYGRLSPGDVVLLTAGMSSPDLCEQRPEEAWRINVRGTGAFVERALGRGARVVFFSTDVIYGERAEGFDEAALPRPTGTYAVTKEAVERAFLGREGFKTLRLSYVFSAADKFTSYLRACNASGERARVFDPFRRAVVYLGDVIDAALALASAWERHPQDTFNVGGPAVLSRIDIANVLTSTHLPRLQYEAVTPDPEFFRTRPKIIAMRSPRLGGLLGRHARTLSEAAGEEFG